MPQDFINSNNSEKYLSLKTAAELYGYTRDHLGLMIRRGKLTGTKLGNYYVTTDNWMVEYLKKYADQNHPVIKNKLSNKFLTNIFSAEKKFETTAVSGKIIKNLPKVINNNKASDVLHKDIIINNTKSNIKSEILKDLAIYRLSSNLSARIKDGKANSSFMENRSLSSSIEDRSLISSDAPYVILPIRKMEEIERDHVLNRLNGADSNIESV